jgi:hypothetical protein
MVDFLRSSASLDEEFSGIRTDAEAPARSSDRHLNASASYAICGVPNALE